MKHICCECGRRHRQCAEVYTGQGVNGWVCILCWMHFDYMAFFTPEQQERLWNHAVS